MRLYTLNCTELHEHTDRNGDHLNSCWTKVEADEELRKLLLFSLKGDGFNFKAAVESQGNEDYLEESEDEESYPFFSEGYLYPVFGKEAARTILAMTRNFLRKLGVEANDLP